MIEQEEDFIKPLETFSEKFIKKDLDDDLDVTIVISGKKGYGKSTLAYWFGKFVDPRFSIQRNFIFEPFYKQIRERIYGLEIKSLPIIDEAVKSLYRQDWYKELQKSMYKLFTMTRTQKQATVLCIPKFQRLRTDFRDDIVDYWVHIATRGLAIIHDRSLSPYEEDTWNLKENMKLFREYAKRQSAYSLKKDINEQLKIFKKMPTYLGYIIFPKMPEGDEKLYIELSNPAKFKLSEERTEEELIGRAKRFRDALMRAIYLLNTNKEPLSQGKIAEELKLHPSTISVWLTLYKSILEKKEVKQDGTPIVEDSE